MKKLLHICFLMLWALNASAQGLEGKMISTVDEKVTSIDNLADGYYLMRNVGRNYYVYEASSDSYLRGLANTAEDFVGKSDHSCLDYVVKVAKNSETGLYTFQFESGQYMPTIQHSTVVVTEATETPVEHTIAAIADAEGQFSISTTEGIHLDGNGSGYGEIWQTIVGWTGTPAAKGNNAYEFYPLTLTDAAATTISITYTTTIGETSRTVATVSDIATYVGSYVDAEAYLPDFTKLASDAKQLVVEGTVKYEFEVEQDTPFEISESFDQAFWQTVRMHSGQYYKFYWQYDGDGEVTCPETIETMGDEHLWAFVGNIIDGFKIYNKAAGGAYTLNKPKIGGNVITNMSVENTNNLFLLAKSTADNNAACFQLKGDDGIYLNVQANKIKTWGAADGGSSCKFTTEVREAELIYVVTQYGVEIGRVPEKIRTYVGEKISPLRALPEFTHTHNGDKYVTVGWEENPTFEFPIHEEVPFVISQNTDNLVYQRVNMSKNSDNTWQYDGETDATEGAVSLTAAKEETVDNQLWAFVGNIFDGFKIYNKAAGNSMTLRKAENGNTVANMSSTDDRNVFMVHKNDAKDDDYVSFKIDEDTYYLNAQSGGIKGWDKADNGSSVGFDPIDMLVQVVYTLEVNGEAKTVKEEMLTIGIGEEITADIALPPFTKAADDTHYKVSATQMTYTFPVVQDLPFHTSDNFENARWHNVLMHTSYSYYYWQYDAEAAEEENVSVPSAASQSLEDKRLWAFVGNIIDGFKIYNKAAGESMTLTKPAFTAEARSYMSTTDANNVFMLHESSVERPTGLCFKLEGDDYYLNAQNLTNDAWTIWGWNNNDQGSSCRFFYKPEVTVTRILVDENGNEIVRRVKTSIQHLADVVEVEVPDFTTTEDETALYVTEEETTLTVTLKQGTLPFQLSENWDNAVWQVVCMSQRYAYCWQYEQETNEVTLGANDALAEEQLWAVMGNVLDGFKFYNFAAGKDMTLYNAEDNEDGLTMSTNDTRNVFKLHKRPESSHLHAALKIEGDRNYLNAHWERDAEGRFIYYLGGYSLLDRNCTSEFLTPGKALQDYTSERLNVPDNLYYLVRDIVGFPQHAITERDHLVAAYQAITGDEYNEEKIRELKNLLDDMEADEDKPVFTPEKKHYRLVNRSNPTKMLAITEEATLQLDDFGFTPQSVVTFEPAANEKEYYIQIQGAYLKPTEDGGGYGAPISVTNNKDEAGIYSIGRPEGLPSFYFLIKDEQQASIDRYITNLYYDNLQNWREALSIEGAHWFVVAADTVDLSFKKIGDKAYSSACYSFPVTMPDGVNAYTGGSEVNDGTLTLSKIEAVPARQGIVLTSAEEGVKKLLISEVGSNGEADETKLLKGTMRKMDVTSESDVYIFGYKGTDVGFYWLPTGKKYVSANKAYMDAQEGAQSIKLRFSEATDIHSVETETNADNAPVYDLSGRMVSHPVKGGIYIKNGKKLILK